MDGLVVTQQRVLELVRVYKDRIAFESRVQKISGMGKNKIVEE